MAFRTQLIVHERGSGKPHTSMGACGPQNSHDGDSHHHCDIRALFAGLLARVMRISTFDRILTAVSRTSNVNHRNLRENLDVSRIDWEASA